MNATRRPCPPGCECDDPVGRLLYDVFFGDDNDMVFVDDPPELDRSVPMPRHRAQLNVPCELLARMLNLPDDVMVRAVTADTIADRVRFLLESPARFPALAPEDIPPDIHLDIVDVTTEYADDPGLEGYVTTTVYVGPMRKDPIA